MKSLAERRFVPVGTDRVWGGKQYTKTGQGWKYVGKVKKGSELDSPVPSFRKWKASMRDKRAGTHHIDTAKPAKKGLLHSLIHRLTRGRK